MADNFDGVDIIYSAISSIEVTAFKDHAPDDQAGEHIVVNSPSSAPSSYGTNDVSVNVNVYVPTVANGMINRSRIKTLKDAVKTQIASAGTSGYYCYIDPEFSGFVETKKKNLSCFTQRFLITINK
ncbi:MAG: hypothetical protein PF690_17500 [Deltaproteobacteria bacterium]|jgi:hypothetical protein|nr:hypothetical protein [Deltaproteobacteria bacterium]